MIYIKINKHNITNNYNDKVKMILRWSYRLWANIKYVVTTLYSAMKMGFFDKIDNVSGSNIIKKVLHWRSDKMFATSASQCRTFEQYTRPELRGGWGAAPHTCLENKGLAKYLEVRAQETSTGCILKFWGKTDSALPTDAHTVRQRIMLNQQLSNFINKWTSVRHNPSSHDEYVYSPK